MTQGSEDRPQCNSYVKRVVGTRFPDLCRGQVAVVAAQLLADTNSLPFVNARRPRP